MGLSQPAVSNAPTRLRGQLKGELFLRSPRGLGPTPRAIEIAGPIHAMLMDLERVLDPAAFDPATARRSFTIAAVDCFSIVVAPRLATRLAREAPGVDVRIGPTAGQAMDLIDRGEIDLAASAFGDAPDRFGHRVIVEDHYACMVAARHPFAQCAPTLRGYAGAQHILVSPRGHARGFVNEELAEKGLTRRIAMMVNHFCAAPGLVAETDLALTAPRKVLEAIVSPRAAAFDCPVAAPPADRRLDILWHERLSRRPAHARFRDAAGLRAWMETTDGASAALDRMLARTRASEDEVWASIRAQPGRVRFPACHSIAESHGQPVDHGARAQRKVLARGAGDPRRQGNGASLPARRIDGMPACPATA